MAWWKPRKVSTHNKPDGTPCGGQFIWGKAQVTPRGLIRRECPECGCRQRWVGSVWLAAAYNPKPGTGRWWEGFVSS